MCISARDLCSQAHVVVGALYELDEGDAVGFGFGSAAFEAGIAFVATTFEPDEPDEG